MTGWWVGVLVLLAVLVRPPRPGARLRRLARTESARTRGASEQPDEALLLDLVAAAMLAGAPPTAAMALAGTATGGHRGAVLRDAAAALLLGAAPDEAWPVEPALDRLRRCIELSTGAGVPAVPLLRAAADTARRDRHRAGERAAARLGVQLALPLGLCAVPAFVAWGVVPVVLSLAGQVGP